MSSSSSKAGDDDDAAGSSNSSRPWSVAEAALASQQHHQAALRGRYELLCVRGKGSFAEVWEARHRRTGHKVAIKIISHYQAQQQQEKERKKMIAREIRVMRLLSQGQHPHVIRFYEAITSSSSTHTYIVMELADAGQLYDHVVLQGRLPEDQARRIFRQLASAVLFCHRNMVAHRDLKMENVLLVRSSTPDTMDVKVVDFGFSKPYTDAKPTMRKKMGSPEYAAPELFSSSSRYVGPHVDVWSCGVILYGMLCGGLPFDAGGGGGDVAGLARNVRRGEYRVPSSWVSDDARDLIAGMLIVRPTKRFTMADVMAHRWVVHNTMPAYLLAMPTSPPPEMMRMIHHHHQVVMQQVVDVDEAVVEEMVTRHGFDRSRLLESLLLQHNRRRPQDQQQDDDEEAAAVAYQLVLATMPDAATRYLNLCAAAATRTSPTSSPPQWALPAAADGGGVLLHDCPRLTMQRIVAVLEEMRIPVLACHRRRHRIKCCAHVVVPPSSATADDTDADVDVEMNMNNNDDSSSGLVFFEIQVYKTTTTATAAAALGGGGDPQHRPQYVVHLHRTSGPQLSYLNICSQLSSRLRR